MSAVTQWKDKSGLGNHLTQATSTNQPQSGTRTIHGWNTIDFDGTNDWLGGVLGNPTAYTSPYTMFVVVLPDVVTDGALAANDNNVGNWLTIISGNVGTARGGSGGGGFWGGVGTLPAIAAGTASLVTWKSAASGSQHLTRVNGGAYGQAVSDNFGNESAALRVGGGPNGNISYLNGTIGEVLMYPTELSPNTVVAIERYLMQKWGITSVATFSPLAIKNLVGWWDAADTASIAATGGLVTQWNDKSGWGHHWLKYGGGGAGWQPNTGTRTQNGLNAIEFTSADTTNLTMTMALPAGLWCGPSYRFVWCVYRADTITQQGENMLNPSGTAGFDWRLGAADTGATGQQSIGITGVSNNIPAGQTARVAGTTYSCAMAGRFDGTTSITPYLNGVQNGTPFTTSVLFNNHNAAWFLGSTSTGFGLKGYLCELVIVDDLVSAADQAALEAYGKAKWGY